MMKKRLNSSSKRKWIVNGALAFGAVALLTTGFATWIIGANNTTANGSTSVTVDTAAKNNINLTLAFDEGTGDDIWVGETTSTGDYINITGNDKKPTDFNVDVTITLEVGKDVKNKPTKLVFSWKEDTETGSEQQENKGVNKVIATADNVDSGTSGEGEHSRVIDTEYTYIDINVLEKDGDAGVLTLPTQSGSGWTVTGNPLAETPEEDVIYVYDGSLTLFTWGTFFDSKAPSAYYNDLYKNGKVTNSSADVDKVYKELNKMYTDLHDKTLDLTLTATSD